MDLTGKKILLVEDQAIVAMTTKMWLKKEGMEVLHALTGEAALKMVKGNPVIDLILMDIDLGRGMDGTEVAREILKEYDIAILFLSSHTEKEVVEKTEEISSYGYVVKGSEPTVLLASMKMAIKLFLSKKEIETKEANLHKLAESLSITLQSIGDGVLATDINGCVTKMNPVAENLCGWTLHEALGKKLHEVFHIINSKTRKIVENPIDVVLKTGKKVDLANHTVLISRNGNEYHIFDSAAPIQDEKGNIFGVVLVFSDVTEKYKKEEILKENEERLRFALEGTNDGLWDVNLETAEVYLSPRGCNILGYRADELNKIVSKWSDLVYEGDLPDTNEKLQKYLNKQTDFFEVEQRLRMKSGELKWIHTRGKIVSYDEDGKPLRMTGTHTDISERKKVEEEFNKSEQKFRTLVENAPIALTISSKGYTIYSNSVFAKLLGYDSVDEVIGLHLSDYAAPEFKQMAIEYVNKREDGLEAPLSYELTALKKNGERVPLLIHVSRVMMPDGMTTIASFTDMTEQKKLINSLRESEEHFKDLFDNAPLGYQSLDDKGQFIEVNATWLKKTGYTREEVIGKKFPSFLTPSSKEKVVNKFPLFKAQGFIQHDLEIIKKDGSIMNILLEGRISHNSNGEFKHTHCVLHDIGKNHVSTNSSKDKE